MKPFLLTIVLIISSNLSKAQTESIPLETSGYGFDSTYLFVSEHSYLTLQIDTLEFYDGYKAYWVIEEAKYRPDTTIRLKTSTYRFHADTFRTTLTYPVFTSKNKKLSASVIDTTWDPMDPSLYKTEKRDSIEIHYSISYPLDYDTFLKTIKEVENSATFQGLNVASIYMNIYPRKKRGFTIEELKSNDFDDVDFISTTFILEKNGVTMDYPIIFE